MRGHSQTYAYGRKISWSVVDWNISDWSGEETLVFEIMKMSSAGASWPAVDASTHKQRRRPHSTSLLPDTHPLSPAIHCSLSSWRPTAGSSTAPTCAVRRFFDRNQGKLHVLSLYIPCSPAAAFRRLPTRRLILKAWIASESLPYRRGVALVRKCNANRVFLGVSR
jgi:hypothetical protein